jgi:retron-type reverse transcriptase
MVLTTLAHHLDVEFLREAHRRTALGALRTALMEAGGGWVVEADIRGFFDNLAYRHLRGFLDQRVRDS